MISEDNDDDDDDGWNDGIDNDGFIFINFSIIFRLNYFVLQSSLMTCST